MLRGFVAEAAADGGERMLSLPPSVRIFIAREPADMRKSFDGLSGLVIDTLKEDPQSGHVFCFFSPDGHDGVVTPPAPSNLVDKAKCETSVYAHVVTQKYADHLPLHRLQGIMKRQGIPLSKSLMWDMCRRSAELLAPIVLQMKTEVLTSKVRFFCPYPRPRFPVLSSISLLMPGSWDIAHRRNSASKRAPAPTEFRCVARRDATTSSKRENVSRPPRDQRLPGDAPRPPRRHRSRPQFRCRAAPTVTGRPGGSGAFCGSWSDSTEDRTRHGRRRGCRFGRRRFLNHPGFTGDRIT